MSERYLKKAHEVYRDAFERYSKLFMVHITLRLPRSFIAMPEKAIKLFTRGLNEKIANHLSEKENQVDRIHLTDVHYVWCREVGMDGGEHYHFMLMLNGNAFRSLGHYTTQNETHLATMISSSWHEAIGLSTDQGRGLVDFSEFKVLKTRVDGFTPTKSWYGHFDSSYEEGFYWLSYLCKIETKQYGKKIRNFGYSQVNKGR